MTEQQSVTLASSSSAAGSSFHQRRRLVVPYTKKPKSKTYAFSSMIDYARKDLTQKELKLKEPSRKCLESIIETAILQGQGQWKTLGYYLHQPKKEVLLHTLQHFPAKYAQWAVEQLKTDFIEQMKTRQQSKVPALSDEQYQKVLYQVFQGQDSNKQLNDPDNWLAVQVIGRTPTQLIVRQVPMDQDPNHAYWIRSIRWSDVRAFNQLSAKEKAAVSPMTKRFHWKNNDKIGAGSYTLQLVTD